MPLDMEMITVGCTHVFVCELRESREVGRVCISKGNVAHLHKLCNNENRRDLELDPLSTFYRKLVILLTVK